MLPFISMKSLSQVHYNNINDSCQQIYVARSKIISILSIMVLSYEFICKPEETRFMSFSGC